MFFPLNPFLAKFGYYQHFINAVVEKDRNRLEAVAVLRLCGPFSHDIPPGIDWPQDLRDLICVHTAYLKGGLEIDGNLISDIDESQIIEQCDIIKLKGIKSVVINSIFSPSDFEELQEERARDIVKKHLPNVNVVISKEG
jgi:N-methylhydantoinase A/oxoprolinase/acetone carboxylase beta subunit